MAVKKTTLMRTDENFKNLMNKLALERVKCGKDKKMSSNPRMSLATYRLLVSDVNLLNRLKMSDFK